MAVEEFRTVPVKGMRKVIARRMKDSLQNSAQLTHTMDADISSLMEQRTLFNATSEHRISVTDILIKVVSKVLAEYDYMNGWMDSESITLHTHVHMGVAVSVDGGLVVPVIREADKKSVVEVSQELKSLSGKARDRKLKTEECTGGTFTISNLGTSRIRYFTPILNEPEIAILGIGGMFESPILEDGVLENRKMMPLSLTFNHCAVDGAPAAQFLQAVCEEIEQLVIDTLQ